VAETCSACGKRWEDHDGVQATCSRLAAVLALCVRRRPCSEVPDAIRWAVTLPGDWGEGYPTREAACEAVLARAKEVAK